jgi:excinuclease ABC subunit A
VIYLGPEGGDGGGTIVAQGTPEQVAQIPARDTGVYLAQVLGLPRAKASWARSQRQSPETKLSRGR